MLSLRCGAAGRPIVTNARRARQAGPCIIGAGAMRTLVVLAGLGQLALAAASLAIPRVLGWREETARLLDLRGLHLGHQSELRPALGAGPRLAPRRVAAGGGGGRLHRPLLGGARRDPVRVLRPRRAAWRPRVPPGRGAARRALLRPRPRLRRGGPRPGADRAAVARLPAGDDQVV